MNKQADFTAQEEAARSGGASLLRGLVAGARPSQWLKTLALMLVGATLALGDFPPSRLFASGFIVVGPLLWGGLYLLNDISDYDHDRRHPYKKQRALASGEVPVQTASVVAWLLVGGALLLSAAVNWPFFICVALMAGKQILYTMPPVRLKRRFPLDVASGSLFNATLRFLCGWFLVSQRLDVPWLFIGTIEGIHVSTFLINRLQDDLGNSRLRRIWMQAAAVITCLAGLLSLALAIAKGDLPFQTWILFLILLLGVRPLLKDLRQKAQQVTPVQARGRFLFGIWFTFGLLVALAWIVKAYS